MKIDVLKQVIPGPLVVVREGLIVLGGLLLAAYVISKFPAVQKFVAANSLTIKDGDGRVLY
jgi:hypothetical protein